MNVTFFIGNGFDLNLGLKTSYKDFYPFFLDHASDSNIIKRWLKEDGLNMHLWADLEERLGERLCRLNNLKENEQKTHILNAKNELDFLLRKYLLLEQDKISITNKENEIGKKFANYLVNFNSKLPRTEKSSIKSTCEKYKYTNFNFCFVCFNYTNILDKFINVTHFPIIATGSDAVSSARNNVLGPRVQIHGSLDDGILLGVNDSEQINNDILKRDEEFLDSFVKPRSNYRIGQERTEDVKKIIDGSRIICVYGMSIGITDRMWWEELIKWLQKYDTSKLVIYRRSTDEMIISKITGSVIPWKNEYINKLLEYGGMSLNDEKGKKLSNRIIIVQDDSLFNFKTLGLLA